MGGFIKRFFFFLLLFSLSSAAYYAVAVEGANFRTGAGLNYQIRWDLDKYYPLKLMQTNGEWLKVQDYQGDLGWVNRSTVNTTKTLIIRNPVVNLRGGPGTNYKKIGTAYKGQCFLLLSSTGEWCRIKDVVTGKISWVYAALTWGSKI